MVLKKNRGCADKGSKGSCNGSEGGILCERKVLWGRRGAMSNGCAAWRGWLFVFGYFVLAGLVLLFVQAQPAAADVPSGFEDRLVTSVDAPTAIAFTPDGRMLVTTKPGQVRLYKNERLLAAPALDLSTKTCANSERGLLGVAVDPDFGEGGNGYVYLYYTYNKFDTCDSNTSRSPVNRVSRFVMEGDTIDPASEEVLVDNIHSPNGNHNAGDLHFGKDGYLYISVGDGGCDYEEPSRCQLENSASRDRHVLLGKILRITRDGDIPAGNPYTGASSERCNVTGRTDPGKDCRETFARGLRNPFRIAFDPNAAGTSFRINDVGGQTWEEIDKGKAGADYGWNVREGHCAANSTTNCGAPPAGMTNPIHDYNHDTGCQSITGGAFVSNGAWPASYDGSYLFGDYVCNKIFKLTPKAGGGHAQTTFATNLGGGGPVAMTFGPDGALYYTTFDGGGEVRRIDHTAGNRAPTAALKIMGPNYGPVPLKVTFDGSGSRDSDGGALTYLWDFGDGDTDVTTTAKTSHTYRTNGTFEATLKVRDSQGAESGPVKVKVYPGDTPPRPAIESSTRLFRVGQQITLNGSATDAEDGKDVSLRWEVLRHHDGDHTHPWSSGTGSRMKFTAPAPEGIFSTDPAGNYLELRLTATDSQGLSRTITQKLKPKTVKVTFQTRPGALELEVNGEKITAPRTLLSWDGYALNVRAYQQKDSQGRTLVFDSWSDRGPARHTIQTPASPATYTATFVPRR